jgi:hypothetical protein
MAAIGNSPTQQAFTPAIDYFSGNGSTTAFTLSRPVASVAQVQVTIDNVAQNPSSAFTVSGNTITFTSAPLSGTNNIYVYYTSPITQVIAPSQGTVTSESFGTITNFTTTGNTVLGDATTDTLTVGVTGIVKDSSGNVGIGTASPSTKLHINNASTSATYLRAENNNGYALFGVDAQGNAYAGAESNDAFGLVTNGTYRAYIDTSGNVGIGTTSPSTKLSVRGTASMAYGNASASFSDNVTGTLYVLHSSGQVFVSSDTAFAFGSGPSATERMRITSGGNVGIGTTAPDAQLHVVGQIRSSGSIAQAIYVYGAPSIAPYITINQFGVRAWDIGAGTYSSGTFSIQSGGANGVYLGGTATSWASASDERLKDIIEPIDNALTKVNGLRSVIGKYKTDEEGVRRSFLIAQDIQTQFPEALESSDPDKLGVQYTDVIPLLVASIKELKAINDTQAETINALTARIVALENR